MDFFVNDLSLCGQFHDSQSFGQAVGQIMEIRGEIQRFGAALYCHRNLASAKVTVAAMMQQAIQGLPNAQRRALMQWLTQHGPYWEDRRFHGPDDYLHVDGKVVTDSAVGEAAFCRFQGLSPELVSFDPSDWVFNPINVAWIRDDGTDARVSVPNHWKIGSIRVSLEAHPKRIDSWTALATDMKRLCTRIIFAEEAFSPLQGYPFAPGAAERIRVLLCTLNKLKDCFDASGQRTAEGHRLYADHFKGEKAWFSDSSTTEKNEFQNELTFPHPEQPNQRLLCTWHGKVKSPQIRIHFSWPISRNYPVYVVYVGPKITKR